MLCRWSSLPCILLHCTAGAPRVLPMDLFTDGKVCATATVAAAAEDPVCLDSGAAAAAAGGGGGGDAGGNREERRRRRRRRRAPAPASASGLRATRTERRTEGRRRRPCLLLPFESAKRPTPDRRRAAFGREGVTKKERVV